MTISQLTSVFGEVACLNWAAHNLPPSPAYTRQEYHKQSPLFAIANTTRGRAAFTLYRCYAADGRLLYIGVSRNLAGRLAVHKSRSLWFGEVHRIETEPHDCRDTARRAERYAISREHPEHNRQCRRRTTVVVDVRSALDQWPTISDAAADIGVMFSTIESWRRRNYVPPYGKQQFLSAIERNGFASCT